MLASVGILYHAADGPPELLLCPGSLEYRRNLLAVASGGTSVSNLIDADLAMLQQLSAIVGSAATHSQYPGQWSSGKPHLHSSLCLKQLEDCNGRWILPLHRVKWDSVSAALVERGLTIRDHSPPVEGLPNSFVNPVRLIPLIEVAGLDGNPLSGGKGRTREEAVRSAQAEAMERVLAAAAPSLKRVFVASAAELDASGIQVPRIQTGAHDAYTTQTRIDWMPAWTLQGAPAAIPAELAFFPYAPRSGIRAFASQHTHGLAVGGSVTEAVWAGLSECLERDAYWILMRCRAHCPPVHVNQFSGSSRAIMEKATQAGLTLMVKDISFDWPLHIVHATLVDQTGRLPALSHGLGSHTTLQRASEKAIAECVQIHADLRRYCEFGLSDVVLPTDQQAPGKSAPAIWADPALSGLFSHLTENVLAHPASIGGLRGSNPDEIVRLIEDLAGPIFWTELGEAGSLHAVRVMIPGCIPPTAETPWTTPRLTDWLNRFGLSFPYSTPILL